jgi:phage terminase large subunit GpA-like protein
MAVDSGYAADFVYAYTKPRQPRAISIKGEGGLGKPLIKGAGTLTKTNQARLITLGVDTGKEEIVNRLSVAAAGPGYCHFPKFPNDEPCHGYDEEYFKGLTAERRIVKSKNGFRTYLWTKRLSQRNEPFDCRNYALAALSLPYSGINLEKMQRDTYEPPKTSDGRSSRFGAVAPAQGEPPTSGGAFGAQNRPLR